MVLSSRISTQLRVALLLGLVLVVHVGLNMAALGGLVFPAFADFEREDAIRNIGRVVHAIRREEAFLVDFSADWAHWDDSYDFVESLDPEYFSGNLTEEATEATPVDLIAIFALDGSSRHLAPYHALVPYQEAVLQRLRADGEWYRHLIAPLLRADAGVDDTISVLLQVEGLPVLASAQAILRSDRVGPSRGVMVMAVMLDPGKLQEQTSVPFSMAFRPTEARFEHSGLRRFSTSEGDGGWLAEHDGGRLGLSVALAVRDGGGFEVATDYDRRMTREGAFALALALGISTLSFMLLVGGLYYRLLARSFLQPLKAIVRELRRVEEDRDVSTRLPVQGAAELQRLALGFNAMMVELEAHRDEIALLSMTDSLTRLPNRRQFEQTLIREWQRAQRQHESLAVLLCDVDFFKAYNDRYGHPAGDECLRRVAQCIQQALKRRTDFAARYGGEEFVLVLPNTSLNGALTAARRVLESLRNAQLPHAGSTVAKYVTISIGAYAAHPDFEARQDDWLAHADAALYAAKAEGRNRVVMAPAGIHATAR